jgi:hypothetical protein
MIIASGSKDALADPTDVAWLLNERQSKLKVKELVKFHKEYRLGHSSFVLAKHMGFFTDDIIPAIQD